MHLFSSFFFFLFTNITEKTIFFTIKNSFESNLDCKMLAAYLKQTRQELMMLLTCGLPRINSTCYVVLSISVVFHHRLLADERLGLAVASGDSCQAA